MMFHMVMLSAALVLGGEPKAVVALPDDASESERFAAGELVRWVRELTGATLPIGAAGRPDQTCVRFARADSDVKDDGFSVTASGREVVLAANRPIGILFGVYHLLGRYGGITWCHPDSGADFVRRPDLTVPDGRLVRNPMARRMGIPSGNGALATPERRTRVALWNVRNGFATGSNRRGPDGAKTQPGNYYPNGLLAKLGDSGEVRTGGHVLGELVLEAPVDDSEFRESLAWTHQHAAEVFAGVPAPDRIRQYARWRVLAKRHPTWFGLVDGARVPTGCALRQGDALKGKSSMPCLSNPEVREQIYRGFKARQARLGDGEPVTFSLCCDDQSQWCECDACLRLLKGKGDGSEPDKASDYWWDFVNDLSARLLSNPLVSLQVYVYRTYQAYPTRVRPVARPRMSIVLCPHGRLLSPFAHGCAVPDEREVPCDVRDLGGDGPADRLVRVHEPGSRKVQLRVLGEGLGRRPQVVCVEGHPPWRGWPGRPLGRLCDGRRLFPSQRREGALADRLADGPLRVGAGG